MNKELTIKIISEILHKLNIPKKKLADNTGISRYRIYNLANPKNNSLLNENDIEKITNRYPEFYKEFLLTGEGPLIKVEHITADDNAASTNQALVNTSHAVLVSSEALKIAAEGFNRLTKSLDTVLEILKSKM